MIKLSLCGYSEAYILAKGTILLQEQEMLMQKDKQIKELIFKNCASFTQSISQIKNTPVDDAKDVNVVVLIYYLIKYAIIIQKHLEVNMVDFRGNSA